MRGCKRELVIALALGLGLTLLFRAFPDIDLVVSGLFHDGRGFPAARSEFLRGLRQIGILLPRFVVFGLVGVIVVKLVWPFRRMLVPPRAVVFLLLSLAAGPGLVTNTILKDNWGRPRPNMVAEFGGRATFVDVWTISDQCPRNCSFVSGEASSAFWTIAFAPLVPAPWRSAAAAAALSLGLATGMLRVAFGGHFLSDVLFAGVITYVVVWLCYWWICRVRPGFADDGRIERGLNRLAHALYRRAAAVRRRLVASWRRLGRLLAEAGDRPIVAGLRRKALPGLASHASPAE